MKVDCSRIRITVKPREEHLDLDISEEWFYERIENWNFVFEDLNKFKMFNNSKNFN